ncbi:hypothetical protein [Streptomyces sp. NPDC057545]|uniref:hypothetical protein n=1 Tax=Streptomyces sp. NPDC057545 TaxID=3346164 RepID=UPI0036C33320
MIAATLALTEHYFGYIGPQGRRCVPLDQAGVLATGRLGDLMAGWEDLSAEEHERLGRLWQVRGDDLARETDFASAARYYAACDRGLYSRPENEEPERRRYLVALHAEAPLALADRHLHQAARLIAARKHLPALAGEGLWQFGTREVTTVRVPAHARPSDDSVLTPLTWSTAPRCGDAHLNIEAVLAQARAHEQLDAKAAWKPQLLEQFFNRLRDHRGQETDRLELPAGRLQILNAPTGTGKSVAMLEIAILAARQQLGPVVVVIPQLSDVFKTVDKLRAIAQHDLADGLLDAAGQPARRACDLHISPLITPNRMVEQAGRAAARGRWDRFDQLAHPCDMKAWITHGPEPAPGEEPCLRLRRVQEDTDDGKLTEAGPRACPRIDHCPRFALLHDAARADIIVTNHHNLLLGSARLPLELDGQPTSRESLLKLLLGRCPLILIDEVDDLQAKLCAAETKQLELAAHGPGTTESPLVQLDRAHRRRPVPPSVTRRIADPLRLARHFAESFLDHFLEGELWLETDDDDHDRPSSNWHLPGTWDRQIVMALLHKSDHDKVSYADLEGLKDLFPAPFKAPNRRAKSRPRRERPRTELPQAAAIRRLLEEATSADHGTNQLPVIKDDLTTVLQKDGHRGVALLQLVNALLVRSWLGCLTDALTKLRNVAAAADAFLPEARPIAELLGTFAQHSPIPHGTLGDSLYGFTVTQNPRPHATGRLNVQSFTGDPHTTMTQLGNTIALGTCGKRRRILAFSATAYFPRAAKTHVHTLPAYLYSDVRPDAVRAKAGHVTRADDDTNDFFRLAGLEASTKIRDMPAFGGRLWRKRLEPHLRDIARLDPDRQRVLTVVNSTHHAFLLASGIAAAAPQPHWVAVVLPASGKAPAVALPPGVVQVTVDELEELPTRHPEVKVIVAPIGPVCRGLNILVPGTERSALYSIWVGTRPVMQIHDPATMYASINAAGIARGGPSLDPAAMLTAQRHAAQQRRDAIIGADRRFSRYPRFLKTEILASILVDLIQLSGRARRGDTDVEIYLVDNAFHDARFGSDYPSLLRTYYAELEPAEQQHLRRTYGSAFNAWIDFASGNPPPLTTFAAL